MFGKYRANSEFSKVQVFTTKISITSPILVGWGHGCIHICGNKPLWGLKVGPSWHFIIHQIMGQILNFSFSPLTSSQIWLNPLVQDCQPTTSPAVFPTDHTTKSGEG
jgi:hypothetical protein